MPRININDLKREYSKVEKIHKGEKLFSKHEEYQIKKQIVKNNEALLHSQRLNRTRYENVSNISTSEYI